jgi:hypothetical protein
MLVRMLVELLDLHVSPSRQRVRKVYVVTPNGAMHEVIGVEKTLGGDAVIVVEPLQQR